MNILEIKEDFPEKGQCVVELEMTEKEKDFLIEFGFNAMLKEVVETFEKKLVERKCFNCDSIISEKVLKEYPDTEICGACIDSGVEE